MAMWITVAATICTNAARESEFNEWFDKIHLPDCLELDCMVRITQYENTESSGGKAKFLAIYEIETDDIVEFKKAVDNMLPEKRAEGKISELVEIESSIIYRQSSSVTK